MRSTCLFVLVALSASLGLGCASRHATTCHAGHCHEVEYDAAGAAIVGGLMLFGALAEVAAQEQRASDAVHGDDNRVYYAPAEPRVMPLDDRPVCQYNPECLPPTHPTCVSAPDGCCPCD